MTKTRPKKVPSPRQVNVLLDDDDSALLAEAIELDRLTQSDTIRRAIRTYVRLLRAEHRQQQQLTG